MSDSVRPRRRQLTRLPRPWDFPGKNTGVGCRFLLPNLVNKTTRSNCLGFPGSSAGKEFSCNAKDLGLIPGLGRSPGGGHGNPLQYSCPENPHGQRSLAGYSPWGCKELDMTEQLSTAYRETPKPYILTWVEHRRLGSEETC